MLILMISTTAMAQDSTPVPGACDDDRVISNNIQLNRSSFKDGTVFVSVHPMKATDLIYRDYLVTAEGLVMVFNSFGWGDNSESTAAREFYFFPRVNSCITYKLTDAGDVHLQMANGNTVEFSHSSAQMSAIEGGSVVVADDVLPNNRGGVEFASYDGLMMDGGYRAGASPTENPNGSSVFRDHNGVTCKIINRELFDYSNDDVRFAMNDQELKKFLGKKCPKITFKF